MNEETKTDDLTKILSLDTEELDKIFKDMTPEEIDDLITKINEAMSND